MDVGQEGAFLHSTGHSTEETPVERKETFARSAVPDQTKLKQKKIFFFSASQMMTTVIVLFTAKKQKHKVWKMGRRARTHAETPRKEGFNYLRGAFLSAGGAPKVWAGERARRIDSDM